MSANEVIEYLSVTHERIESMQNFLKNMSAELNTVIEGLATKQGELNKENVDNG